MTLEEAIEHAEGALNYGWSLDVTIQGGCMRISLYDPEEDLVWAPYSYFHRVFGQPDHGSLRQIPRNMTLPQKFINGQLYHFCDPSLQCRADMLNAVIVEAKVHGHHALILTPNESEAEAVLREELTARGIIDEY